VIAVTFECDPSHNRRLTSRTGDTSEPFVVAASQRAACVGPDFGAALQGRLRAPL